MSREVVNSCPELEVGELEGGVLAFVMFNGVASISVELCGGVEDVEMCVVDFEGVGI